VILFESHFGLHGHWTTACDANHRKSLWTDETFVSMMGACTEFHKSHGTCFLARCRRSRSGRPSLSGVGSLSDSHCIWCKDECVSHDQVACWQAYSKTTNKQWSGESYRSTAESQSRTIRNGRWLYASCEVMKGSRRRESCAQQIRGGAHDLGSARGVCHFD
jgi:hypothetical protein